ncbi:MAG: beta-galactosidase [Prevotella sp.]|nr:beta-galactosidase [Prevotella sp.]
MKHFLLLIGLLLSAQGMLAREVTQLKDWKFYPAYDVNRKPKMEDVTVPHTWNMTDVFDDMKYERGTYVYERMLTLSDNQRKDKRFFLRFDGVNSFAEVAVNQQYVGQHAGGYTAFTLEITDKLKTGDNKLSVVVSNAYRTDVAPLAGDFNMYGGITRPVWLIVTGQDCISPLDYGSNGVYIHQDKVTPEQVDLRIETVLSQKSSQNSELRITIVDKDGKVVAETNDDKVKLKNPILWNGRKNPYLYKVRVELLQNGKVIDCVAEQTGVRYFSLDAEKGFFLNGQHLDLHGVCRHEEGYRTGGLYNEAAMRQDADIISELGCTGVRFVHYPHSKYDVQQYDERGIVVWQELNLAGPGGYNSPGYMKNPQLEANVMQNLIEMVKQHYNSPAICFWSLCNELSFKYDEPATFLRRLHEKAKELDSQRLTTLAICYDQDKFQGITDCIGWNKYFGYYEKKGGVGDFMDKAHKEAGLQPIGLCEYGAAGSHLQHGFEPKVTNKIHYEENQARVHEENWRDMHTRDYAWCKFIWQYADNPSSIRDEGDQRGMNDKGIVSYDRTVRKDAYYFYKANWSSEPVLYIAARRYTQRTDAKTDVKVYTNQPQATLYLNDKRIGKARKDEIGRIVFKDVTLLEGENTIRVTSGKLSDECTCILNGNKRQKQPINDERLDGAVN